MDSRDVLIGQLVAFGLRQEQAAALAEELTQLAQSMIAQVLYAALQSSAVARAAPPPLSPVAPTPAPTMPPPALASPPPPAPPLEPTQAAPAFWGNAVPHRPVKGATPALSSMPAPQNVQMIHTAPPSSGRVEMSHPQGLGMPGSTLPQTPYAGELQPGESRVVIRNPDGTIETPRVGAGAPPGALLFGPQTPPLAAQHSAAPGVAPPAPTVAMIPPPATAVASSMAPAGLASEIVSVRKANSLDAPTLAAMKRILEGKPAEASAIYSLTMLGLVERGEGGALQLSQEGREVYYTAQHTNAAAAAPAAAEGAP